MDIQYLNGTSGVTSSTMGNVASTKVNVGLSPTFKYCLMAGAALTFVVLGYTLMNKR